jgi:hypothetical protein
MGRLTGPNSELPQFCRKWYLSDVIGITYGCDKYHSDLRRMPEAEERGLSRENVPETLFRGGLAPNRNHTGE